MFIVGPGLAFLFAKFFVTKAVPAAGQMEGPMGKIFLFVIFSFLGFFLYGFGDIIGLASSYMGSKP